MEQEKRRGKANNPGALFRPDGTLSTDPAEILDLQYNFYKNLYTKKKTDLKNMNYFSKNLNKITDEDRNKLCTEIADKEIGEALFELPNNGAPGGDGFTTDKSSSDEI